jgi:ribosomal protein S18 acetylase RimI-like enzyme
MKIVNYAPRYREDLAKLFNDFHNSMILVEADFNYGKFKSNEKLLRFIDKMAQESQEKGGFIYLAIVGGSIAGFIQGVIQDHSKDEIYSMVAHQGPSIQGWIGELYVDPSYRNQGIGLSLMKKAKSYFESEDCTSMRLNVYYNNPTAIEFYNKFGLRTISLEMGERFEK